MECMGVHTQIYPLAMSGTERSVDIPLNRFKTYKFVSQTQFQCEFSTSSILFLCVFMCRSIDGRDFQDIERKIAMQKKR